ncbi:tRNA lysidine(34) synthetase TilS [Noviherbaspirillum denitrificans]|uniref:tRNA(Ile)-lysidine synthase n=1 Tax=Noviherbaspirillum denitrificans TaxID=1968433 RepID=A0A254TDX7_9BURK|nr:tRNA lysidine(34) synthetase TilS [Noviherbaspirillum denitrificans]OWW20859.1 tRNA(Ile)-lysidine synthase [Noviherbaspirillum denitrificans]
MTNRQAASIEGAFERALGEILARVSASAPRFAVAYSGGLDSAVLLHLASSYARVHGIELIAFHVHHGLSNNADAWLAHCERGCAALGVSFDARRVSVESVDRHGLEQAARTSRYRALGDLSRLHGVHVLLTAHHLDDQAETVLLQLLRGSGLPGLSGMAFCGGAPALLGFDTPLLARPLLERSRAELEAFAVRHGISHIVDESNEDLRYARNAIRHAVTPVLNEYFPGYQHRLSRVAAHAQSAQRLLDELAAMDWQSCSAGSQLDLSCFAVLSQDRQYNLLRYWLSQNGMRMPSTAWLFEMRTQLLCASKDAQVRVVHPQCEVHTYRGRAYLVSHMPLPIETAKVQAFRWQGQGRIPFPAFGGELYFEGAAEGVSSEWLMAQLLEIRHRQGGEKLKLSPGRPTRSLKHHYQDLNIPAWERQRLPVVFAGGRLVFAAGIGMSHLSHLKNPGSLIQMHWVNDIK